MRFQTLKIITFTLALLTTSAGQASDPNGIVWIDVRSTVEYQLGHIDGAVHIPYEDIVEGTAALQLKLDQPIYLYCQSGGRAGKAQLALAAAGYTEAVNIGGLSDAKQVFATLNDPVPVETNAETSP